MAPIRPPSGEKERGLRVHHRRDLRHGLHVGEDVEAAVRGPRVRVEARRACDTGFPFMRNLPLKGFLFICDFLLQGISPDNASGDSYSCRFRSFLAARPEEIDFSLATCRKEADASFPRRSAPLPLRELNCWITSCILSCNLAY